MVPSLSRFVHVGSEKASDAGVLGRDAEHPCREPKAASVVRRVELEQVSLSPWSHRAPYRMYGRLTARTIEVAHDTGQSCHDEKSQDCACHGASVGLSRIDCERSDVLWAERYHLCRDSCCSR